MEIDVPPSPTSTPSSQPSHDMTLSLSSLPPLITPSPPSNTLLITNLTNPQIFIPSTLSSIRALLSQHFPLHSFSPLKSLRRIIVTFYTADASLSIRQMIDGTSILDSRVKCYFGAPTRIQVSEEERYLQAPKQEKMFFISPPPSPPAGWEMRDEEPPNKSVHAEDLAKALNGLEGRRWGDNQAEEEMVEDEIERMNGRRSAGGGQRVLYDPEEHGGRLDLPAVTVEDTGGEEEGPRIVLDEDGDEDMDVEGGQRRMDDGFGGGRIIAHTARPPTELMDCS